MTENIAAPTEAQPAADTAEDAFTDQQALRESQLGGAAAFADAETREILNLLGDAEAGGSCCGGGCCSV